MYENNDIEVKFSTKHLPLEFRLIVNKELYDDNVIDLKTFKTMEQSLIARLTKIKKEYQDDLTNSNNGGTIQAT